MSAKILICEDDTVQREIIADILDTAGYAAGHMDLPNTKNHPTPGMIFCGAPGGNRTPILSLGRICSIR